MDEAEVAEELIICTSVCCCCCCSLFHCCCIDASCRKLYYWPWSVLSWNKVFKFPYIYTKIKENKYHYWVDVFILYMKRTLYLSFWIVIYMFISMTPLLCLRINLPYIEPTTPAPTSPYYIISNPNIFTISLLIATVGIIVWFFIIWSVSLSVRLLTNFLTLYMKMIYNVLFQEHHTYLVLAIVHFVYFVTFLIWFISFIVDFFGIFSNFYDYINFQYFGDEINDVIDKYTQRISNEKYAEHWIYSLVLSPLFILVLIFIKLKCSKDNKLSAKQSLLLLSDREKNDDEKIDCLPYNGNKTLLNTIFITHSVLLLLWIFWQLFTFQTLILTINFNDEIEINTDTTSRRPAEFTALESFAILYSTTTFIKLLCNKLFIPQFIKNKETVVTLKLGIYLFVSMLYNLGLKFVFSNVKEWTVFLIISGLNCVGYIAFYGAFLSHKSGKNMIIKIKQRFNSLTEILICKKLVKIHQISDKSYWNAFDHELALNLGIRFIISVYSYFIMIVYLLMFSLILDINVNKQVYVFLSIDFLFGIVVFMAQLYCFDKKHLRSFAEIWYLSLNTTQESLDENVEIELEMKSNISLSKASIDSYSSIDKNIEKTNFDIGEIIFYQMMLSWIWIGTLTGIPYDLKQ